MVAVRIPREIPTRFQLLPGVGFAEIVGFSVGGAVGVGAWYLFGLFPQSLPRLLAQVIFAGLPPVAGFLAVTGGERSMLAWMRRASRFSRSRKKLTYQSVHPDEAAVQTWWPVDRVSGGVMVRRDGTYVAGLTVQPSNLLLMQPDQLARIVTALKRVIITMPMGVRMQWIAIDQPVDVAGAVGHLDELRRQTQVGPRSDGLLLYRQHIERLSRAGATEKRYFILIGGTRRQSGEDMRHLALEAANVLRSGGILAAAADDAALRHLLQLWSRPADAVTRTPEFPTIPYVRLPSQEEPSDLDLSLLWTGGESDELVSQACKHAVSGNGGR